MISKIGPRKNSLEVVMRDHVDWSLTCIDLHWGLAIHVCDRELGYRWVGERFLPDRREKNFNKSESNYDNFYSRKTNAF